MRLSSLLSSRILRPAPRLIARAALPLAVLVTPVAFAHAAGLQPTGTVGQAIAPQPAAESVEVLGAQLVHPHAHSHGHSHPVLEITIPGLVPMQPAPMPPLDPVEFSAKPSMTHVPTPWTRQQMEAFTDVPSAIAQKFGIPTAEAKEPAVLKAAAVGEMQPLNVFQLVWPAQGKMTTYFGEVGPYSPRGHAGLDIAAPQGTPILAAAAGKVTQASFTSNGYGGLVVVDHGNGYESWYAHLSGFKVAPGQQVKQGELIGAMGSTGYSTGPHLHFELREKGDLRDPMKFLK